MLGYLNDDVEQGYFGVLRLTFDLPVHEKMTAYCSFEAYRLA